jgi:urease accessory protein UreE
MITLSEDTLKKLLELAYDIGNTHGIDGYYCATTVAKQIVVEGLNGRDRSN